MFQPIEAWDGIKVIREDNGRAGLLLQPFSQSAGAELAGISVVNQAVEELLATGITPGAGSRIPSLHIGEIVIDFHHGGPAQQAALADQPEGLQIQGHREHEQVGGQGGGVAVASIWMHLEHLHSWQGGQGGSGLMHPVMLITATTEAADHNNAHGAQLGVALITVCSGAGQPGSIGLEPVDLSLGVVNAGDNSLDVATQLKDGAGLSRDALKGGGSA